jgi:hypothetical protein
MSVATVISTTAAVASAMAGHGFDPIPAQQAAGPVRSTATAAEVRGGEPAPWCGVATAQDDVSNELDNGPMKYHAIYAVPADAPDRLGDFATTIQSGAMGASALIERLRGRAIRFDMGTSCGKQFLDISDVRLRRTSAEWASAAQDETTFAAALNEELRTAGFGVMSPLDDAVTARGRQVNYVVWFDMPVAGVCGQATRSTDTRRSPDNLNAWGGKIAVVFRVGDSFCGADGVRHEIGHTLGALVPAAPHAFDGAHCNDAAEDTMCYPSSPRVTDGPLRVQYFDYGDDDYWGPLNHWTVDLSPFLCPDATCNAPAGTTTTTTATGGFEAPPPARSLRVKVRKAVHARWRIVVSLSHGRTRRIAVRCRGRRAARGLVHPFTEVALHARCGRRPRVAVAIAIDPRSGGAIATSAGRP